MSTTRTILTITKTQDPKFMYSVNWDMKGEDVFNDQMYSKFENNIKKGKKRSDMYTHIDALRDSWRETYTGVICINQHWLKKQFFWIKTFIINEEKIYKKHHI